MRYGDTTDQSFLITAEPIDHVLQQIAGRRLALLGMELQPDHLLPPHRHRERIVQRAARPRGIPRRLEHIGVVEID